MFLDSPLARSATKRQSILSFGSRQPDALERVLDMKEYLDKQMKKEEKGQKVVEAETVQTGTVSTLFGCYFEHLSFMVNHNFIIDHNQLDFLIELNRTHTRFFMRDHYFA